MQQQPDGTPAQAPADDQFERILSALCEDIEKLDTLGLADERGRVIVEPASTLHWS
jgi:hypothetical protein